MKTYEQVDAYMQEVGLKYIKSTNDFLTGLAIRTDKDYTTKIAEELNMRATGKSSGNSYFYQIKNENFDGSIFVSAAFDGGVFRHIGNIIIDNPQLFTGTVADLACDCGIVTCFIAKMYPECNVIGVDINQSAVDNAERLAKKLGLTNVSFVCADVFALELKDKVNAVTSFRGILDVCEKYTKGLPFFGEKAYRELLYKNAFADYAKAVKNIACQNAKMLFVERYTPDYGLLGFMEALCEEGIYPISDKCSLMKAADLSSVKEYSVTFAQLDSKTASPDETISNILSKGFKSGAGYEGYMAEYALYADCDSAIRFFDVYNAKSQKLVHQFAIAKSKSGKIITYEANANKKKVKYLNAKKEELAQKDIRQKLTVYNQDDFEIKEYEIVV